MLSTLQTSERTHLAQIAIEFQNVWISKNKASCGLNYVVKQIRLYEDPFPQADERASNIDLSDLDVSSMNLDIRGDRVFLMVGDSNKPIRVSSKLSKTRFYSSPRKKIAFQDKSKNAIQIFDKLETHVIKLLAKKSKDLFGEKMTIKQTTDKFRSFASKESGTIYSAVRSNETDITTSLTLDGEIVKDNDRQSVLEQRVKQDATVVFSIGPVWISADKSSCGINLTCNHIDLVSVPQEIVEYPNIKDIDPNLLDISYNDKTSKSYLNIQIGDRSSPLRAQTGKIKKRRLYSNSSESYSPPKLYASIDSKSDQYSAFQNIFAEITKLVHANSQQLFGEERSLEDIEASFRKCMTQRTRPDGSLDDPSLNVSLIKTRDNQIRTQVFVGDDNRLIENPLKHLSQDNMSIDVTLSFSNIWVSRDKSSWGVTVNAETIRTYDDSISTSISEIDLGEISIGKLIRNNAYFYYGSSNLQVMLPRLMCKPSRNGSIRIIEMKWTKYFVDLALDMDENGENVMKVLSAIDDRIVELATEKWDEWFGEEVSREEIQSRYRSIVNASDTYGTKVSLSLPNMDCFQVQVTDSENEPVGDVVQALSQSNLYVTSDIIIKSLWFNDTNFGVNVSCKTLNITETQEGVENAESESRASSGQWHGGDDDDSEIAA